MEIKKSAFIVSCQALEDEELFGEGIMLKMANAALAGGADFIRTSQLHNIKDMKENLSVPIIGLIKRNYPDCQIYITPTIKELRELIDSNVDIIAIDATNRIRPNSETLADLVTYFKANRKPNQLLMADCSNIEDIKSADELGFDMIGTTLRGYTDDTKNRSNKENDYEFLKQARQITNKYLIAEGGLDTPKDAANALRIVKDAVVVGSAITRPKYITNLFALELNKERK